MKDVEPRMDLETRCISCRAYRYEDVNNYGEWEGDNWKCAICSQSGKLLSRRTKRILELHDDGILIHKDEYAKLLKEWSGLA